MSAVGFLFSPVPACATTIFDLGSIAYNTLIPGDIGFHGVTHLAIDNLTGSSALPPALPVTTTAMFLNARLSVNLAGGSTQTVLLGDIGPGASTSPLLAFADTTLISSAVFSATLSSVLLTLFDGAPFMPASTQLSVSLLPAYGPYLPRTSTPRSSRRGRARSRSPRLWRCALSAPLPSLHSR